MSRNETSIRQSAKVGYIMAKALETLADGKPLHAKALAFAAAEGYLAMLPHADQMIGQGLVDGILEATESEVEEVVATMWKLAL